LKVGFGIPRKVGEPPAWRQNTHGDMLRLGQKAEALGFDSIWVPDHYFFERPPGVFTPYPEAWTLMTALLVGTRRAQVGSMVLAAGFRHPARLAHMAGALQELCGGRLLLGLGAGNQPGEHAAFGIDFERRVGRFDEYLQILTGLLDGETLTFQGRHYQVREASLLYRYPKVPILIAAGGERMMRLTARYADAFNGAGGGRVPSGRGGEGFRGKLAELHAACRAIGRDPAEIEVTYSATVVVLPDAAATRRAIEVIAAKPPAVPPDEVRARYAIGTPDEVAVDLLRARDWGAQHLVLGLGAEPFTLWSEESLELFAAEVLPRLKAAP
jgi:alkanesulfonate monooxygenase SsuD/methylene tetrahydromethanopterin reductase-like flavin-dependent oxidoreductase (luciferase family)